MINRGGENVYCVEVENAIASHPAVFEVAVIGVPDRMMGEKVGVVIMAKPGSQVDANEIVSFLHGRIADFKIPQYVAFRAQPLPRNAGGKILKPVLRKDTEWGSPVR
jgi:acyl-CoA synthetase (AMP-forming)/AMP-acid ligase II